MFEQRIELKNVISKYRKIHNLSLRAASEKTRVSHTFLGKIETGNGNANPTMETLGKIANGFKLPFYQLLCSADYDINLSNFTLEDINWTTEQLEKELTNNYKIEALTQFKNIYIFKKKVLVDLKELNPLLKLTIDPQKMEDIALMNCNVSLNEAIELCLILNTNFNRLFRVKKPFYDLNIDHNDDIKVAYQIHKYIEKIRLSNELEKNELKPDITQRIDDFVKDIKSIREVDYLEECLNIYRRHLHS